MRSIPSRLPWPSASARLALSAATAACLAGPSWPAAPPRLGELEAALVSGESATAVLSRWCADHALADPPRIVAVRDRSVRRPATPEVRRRLRARAGEVVAYRRVSLACGARVLSKADNWYLPDHLTGQMNQTLATTDTPFGQVVRPLGFRRIILGAGHPRPSGSRGPVFRVTAVLVDAGGRPFSLVRETYLGALSP